MKELVALLETDANAANAFGALASAGAALLAVVVSAISVWISVWAVRSQRKHNALSVRPLAEVTVADYEDSLRVKLRNNGIGPMILTEVTVLNGSNAHSSIIECMPPLPKGRPWNAFSHALCDRTLQAGGEIVLLELTRYECEASFAQCRVIVRSALAKLTVRVEYTDVYGSVMPPRTKVLSWFGRDK